MYKTDILAFGAHPDDVELSCSGTLAKHAAAGHRIAIADLTRGELGTRGSVASRDAESKEATRIIGALYRENLNLKDGFFKNDEQHQLAVIRIIRKYQPDIILCNAISDRHPDHGRASALVSECCFLSGLVKIETKDEAGQQQQPWKPRNIYHYIQDRYHTPAFVVDISGFMEHKMNSIQAYKTQFYDPKSNEPATYISSPEFLMSIKNRDAEFGRLTGVAFAEGFTAERIVGVRSLHDLL